MEGGREAVTKLIVDASATAPYLFDDERDDRIPQIVDAARNGRCAASGVWPYEVANMLRRALSARRISDDQLPLIADLLQGLAVDVDAASSDRVLRACLALATRHGVTAYDASYLELAVRLGAELATFDGELRNAALAEGLTIHPAP